MVNVISRHTAWTDVLLGNRAPGVTLYDWLNHMDATAQTYVDAGDATQIKDDLNQREVKELLTIIGKQISDHEDTVIRKVAPQFGQKKAPFRRLQLR